MSERSMLQGLIRYRPLPALALMALPLVGASQTISGTGPWDADPAVRQVLELRRAGIEAMTAGTMGADTERYSSTFVAHTPNATIVPGDRLLELFARGTISYEAVDIDIEYAGSHGPDIVVLMGEETVVPGTGAPNAGKRIVRRFTDVFRLEDGEWRHDLRHANVLRIED